MDGSCLTVAWHKHERELLGWLTRSLGDRPLAEDLLQDVYLKAHLQGQVFCSLDQPRAWLFQVARNAMADLGRRHRHCFVDLPEDLEQPQSEAPPAVDALADCLPRALAELKAADRQALELCDLRGMSQAEFAALLGLSLPGAKSRVQRARRQLRARLTANCQVRFDAQGRICCFTPRQR